MSIINGKFDTDLDDWNIRLSGSADVTWDDGRAKLYSSKCNEVFLEQAILITDETLRFDYETKGGRPICWYDKLYNASCSISISTSPDSTTTYYYLLEHESKNTMFIDLSEHVGKEATLSFNIEGYECCDDTIQVWIDNVTLVPNLSTLEISSMPSNAEIYINDVLQEVTTPVSIQLYPDEHKITLKKEGYYDYIQHITVCSGDIYVIDHDLIPLYEGEYIGELLLFSAPTGAVITIDGIELDVVTPTSIILEPGYHTYKLSLIGYADTSSSFTILLDKTTIISAQLTQITITKPGINIGLALISGFALLGLTMKKR